MNTIEEAKQFLRENFEDGCHCPCCGQNVKLYRRSINAGLALFLIQFNKVWECKTGDERLEGVHVSEIIGTNMVINGKNCSHYSTLMHWGLIQRVFKSDHEKVRTSGYWRLTDEGAAFVQNKLRVPKYVMTFDGTVESCSDNVLSIEECLGKDFDYRELISHD